jgi:hypothetical protein
MFVPPPVVDAILSNPPMGVIDGAAGSGAFIQDAKKDAKSENHMVVSMRSRT